MEQLDWLRIAVGVCGSGLIINSILILMSPSYFSRLDKVYFIGSVSKTAKERTQKFVEKSKKADCSAGITACIGLGIIAILWSVGKIESATLPLLILTAVLFLQHYFLKGKQ